MRGGDPNELEEAIQKATQLKDAQEEVSLLQAAIMSYSLV